MKAFLDKYGMITLIVAAFVFIGSVIYCVTVADFSQFNEPLSEMTQGEFILVVLFIGLLTGGRK